ncbi:hypothetical protein [Chryseobacterium sp. POE27]|uniref:hypothetical protein n=1 Tax=Chryseobacterium sp. POE27 TaxID=3138177 RepID=UPI00321980AA
MKKSYYQRLAGIGILLIILFAFQKYRSKGKEDFSEVHFITNNSIVLKLAEFDPNELDEKQWQNLGFTTKQVKTILNYKKSGWGRVFIQRTIQKMLCHFQ